MKRIISVFLVLVMLSAAMMIPAEAAGTLVHSDTFDEGIAPKNWETGNHAFKWHRDGYIYGYADARVLESRYTGREQKIFDQFYVSYDIRVCGFDDLNPSEITENHVFGFWYRDLFENEGGSQGCVYQFFIEVETGDAYILKSTYDGQGIKYRDEHGILQTLEIKPVKICEGNIGGPVPMGEDIPFAEIGMRVTEGRIEGYYNQQLVCFAEYDPNAEKLGDTCLAGVDATVGSQKCPILIWNGRDGNYHGKLYINIDNFEVWTPDYDFANTAYGDVDGNGKINLGDVSAMLKKIAKYDVTIDEDAADVDVNGKLNLADVSMVLKYIAKWDVTLGQAK